MIVGYESTDFRSFQIFQNFGLNEPIYTFKKIEYFNLTRW